MLIVSVCHEQLCCTSVHGCGFMCLSPKLTCTMTLTLTLTLPFIQTVIQVTCLQASRLAHAVVNVVPLCFYMTKNSRSHRIGVNKQHNATLRMPVAHAQLEGTGGIPGGAFVIPHAPGGTEENSPPGWPLGWLRIRAFLETAAASNRRQWEMARSLPHDSDLRRGPGGVAFGKSGLRTKYTARSTPHAHKHHTAYRTTQETCDWPYLAAIYSRAWQVQITGYPLVAQVERPANKLTSGGGAMT